MKELGKLFAINPEAYRSELMKDAAKKYKEVFSPFNERQMLVINQCLFFFNNAGDAYTSWYANYLCDEERIKFANASAVRCLVHYGNIVHLLRKNDAKKFADVAVCEGAIDKTSEMLVARGWHGMPAPYDREGVRHYKTAHGIVEDMKQFINARGSMLAAAEEERSNKR